MLERTKIKTRKFTMTSESHAFVSKEVNSDAVDDEKQECYSDRRTNKRDTFAIFALFSKRRPRQKQRSRADSHSRFRSPAHDHFRNRNICVDAEAVVDVVFASSSMFDPPGSEYGPRCFGGPYSRRRH